MSTYPISVEAELPARVARWRPLVHWLLAIPHVLILWVLGAVVSVLAFICWVAGVFTGRIPLGLLRFTSMYLRYTARFQLYALFMTPAYPPFEFIDSLSDPGNYSIRMEARPQPTNRNRVTIFFRLIFAIPQALFGILIGIAMYFITAIAFFAVIIMGRWPTPLRDFAVGVIRWNTRVNGYIYLLVDDYPPFSLV